MRKLIILGFAIAAIVMLVGSVFAGSSSEMLLTEEDENATYDPTPSPFGEDLEPPDADAKSTILDAQAAGHLEADTKTTGTCWGACGYMLSGDTPVAIRCHVPEQSVVPGDHSVVGFAYHDGSPNFNEPNRIIMCKKYPVTDTVFEWVRVGYCDRGSINTLTVFGMNAASTAARDVMGIARFQVNDDRTSAVPIVGEDCNMGNFTNVFEAGSLNMYGRGYYDKVYGSQFDDAELNGEFVNGLEGGDTIHLDNDEFPDYSIGYGDDGADDIIGTSTRDDIYGDDPSDPTNAGLDFISGSRGNDLLRGSEFEDEIHGGDGSDLIWGGNGKDLLYGDNENDVIYGMSGDDNIWGGNGDDNLTGGPGIDGCNGEAGTDTCNCDGEFSCEL